VLTLASFGNRDSTQRLSLNARLLSGTNNLSGWSSDLMFMKPNVHRALINKANAIVVQGFVETQVATFAVPAAMPWSTAAAARWSAVGCFFVAVAASSTLSEFSIVLPMLFSSACATLLLLAGERAVRCCAC
jgi:hypothetical protein